MNTQLFRDLIATLRSLGLEPLRLLFPLCALHAAIWPVLWVIVRQYTLPFNGQVPAGLWHGTEMLFGSFGAALAGFLLTAIPEWTRTKPCSARLSYGVAVLWALARLASLIGLSLSDQIALVADGAWMGLVLLFCLRAAVSARTPDLNGFLLWLCTYIGVYLRLRFAALDDDYSLCAQMLIAGLLVYCGFLGLALARIVPPITNRVVDPSRRSTPYLPHPGRRHTSVILSALCLLTLMMPVSQDVQAYLLIGTGAAFLDRTADGFIGIKAFRAELLALNGAAALTGSGLIMLGLSSLSETVPRLAGLHLLSIGGLGLGIMAVFAIAGRLHTHQELPLSPRAQLALGLLVLSMPARLAPEFIADLPAALLHGLASLLWAAAFLIWLLDYFPAFRSARA
ncbi:MAG: NnrS family protein [Asticcacaulis sp.]